MENMHQTADKIILGVVYMNYFNLKGEFIGSKEDYQLAEEISKKCKYFKLDDEDELVSDEEISCFNCRYRRWSPASFTCKKMEV